MKMCAETTGPWGHPSTESCKQVDVPELENPFTGAKPRMTGPLGCSPNCAEANPSRHGGAQLCVRESQRKTWVTHPVGAIVLTVGSNALPLIDHASGSSS